MHVLKSHHYVVKFSLWMNKIVQINSLSIGWSQWKWMKIILVVRNLWFIVGELKHSVKSPDTNAPIKNSGFCLKASVKYNNFWSIIFNVITVKQNQLVLDYLFSSGWWKSLKIFVVRFSKIMPQKARNLIRITKEISNTDIMDFIHSHTLRKSHMDRISTCLPLNTSPLPPPPPSSDTIPGKKISDIHILKLFEILHL